MKKYYRIILVFLFIVLAISVLRLHAQAYRQVVQAGFRMARNGNGIAAADYNNDGFIDIYYVSESVYNPKRLGTANCLFKNNGDGTFVDVAKEAGVTGVDNSQTDPKILNNYGASWGDYDNDGFVDLYLTNKGPDELYKNMGDGTFKNVTASAGLEEIVRESTSAAWFDYDKDGDADLFVGAYGEYGSGRTQDNVLYRNNGDGTFTDVTAEAGLGDAGYTYMTLVVDANSDGWPDLYCVNDFGANRFYLSKGNGTFREATREYRLEDNGHGMGATLGDFDNDGRFDIYLTNISDDESGTAEEWNPLFKHLHSGTYEEVAKRASAEFAGWGWGVEFFDFDLDGNLDIYVVNGFPGVQTHNYFYHNSGNGTFKEISQEVGLASEAEARGLCVADLNGDGRLDVAIANYHQPVAFYLNQTTSGNYLKVNLVGTQSSRDAWGAVVIAEANSRKFYRKNDGLEFFGQSKLPIHFGLGDASVVQRLTLEWPSGSVQDFYDIPANQTITVNEDLGITTGVKNNPASPLPQDFALLRNHPNPVTDHTTLRFRIGAGANVRVEIYDLLGHLLATPIQGAFSMGEHSVRWDGRDKAGHLLPSGIYIQRFFSEAFVSQRKFIIVR